MPGMNSKRQTVYNPDADLIHTSSRRRAAELRHNNSCLRRIGMPSNLGRFLTARERAREAETCRRPTKKGVLKTNRLRRAQPWRVACGVWRVACGDWILRKEAQHAELVRWRTREPLVNRFTNSSPRRRARQGVAGAAAAAA